MPWGGFFDVPKIQARITELEGEISAPDFWANSDAKNSVIQELKRLKSQSAPYLLLQTERHDLEGLLAIVEESDVESLKHLESESEKLTKKIELLEFQNS